MKSCFFPSTVLLFHFSILLDVAVYVIFIISKFCCTPNFHACIMRASVKLPLSNLLNKNYQKQRFNPFSSIAFLLTSLDDYEIKPVSKRSLVMNVNKSKVPSLRNV